MKILFKLLITVLILGVFIVAKSLLNSYSDVAVSNVAAVEQVEDNDEAYAVNRAINDTRKSSLLSLGVNLTGILLFVLFLWMMWKSEIKISYKKAQDSF